MTSQTAESSAQEAETPKAPKVFHLAATPADELSKNHGGPWTTLCGIRKPTCRQTFFGFELAPMEKCAVCTAMRFGL